MKKALKIILLIAAIAMVLAIVFMVFAINIVGDKYEPNKHKAVLAEQLSPLETELNNALEDPSIDDYYKETLNKGRLIIADDDKMLAITDSLFNSNPKKDFFYFMVFTRSMNGSDGFYSEALDVSSHKFILSNTVAFAHYFAGSTLLTETDMENWARYVIGELFITNDANHAETIINEVNILRSKLIKNVDGQEEKYKATILLFLNKIDDAMWSKISLF